MSILRWAHHHHRNLRPLEPAHGARACAKPNRKVAVRWRDGTRLLRQTETCERPTNCRQERCFAGPSKCTGIQATTPCLGDRLRQREVETLVDCLSHAGIRAVQHFTKCTAGLVFRLAEQLSHFGRSKFAEVHHAPASPVGSVSVNATRYGMGASSGRANGPAEPVRHLRPDSPAANKACPIGRCGDQPRRQGDVTALASGG